MENKINILEVAKGLGIGGAERVVQEFVFNIDKDKFNVYLGAFNDTGVRKAIIEEAGFDIIKLSNDNILNVIKEYKIEVVHLHNYDPKLIELLHGKIKIIQTHIFQNYSPLVDRNLYISKALYNKCRHFYPLEYGVNSNIIYNPCNIDAWNQNKLPQEIIDGVKLNYGIKEGDFVIGRLGRSEPSKTDFLLIASVQRIAKKIPNVKFLFVGLPKLYVNILSDMPNLKGKLIFLPTTPDDYKISRFYQTIDVFWHTASKGESFGITNVEAMIFKKPVVTHSTDWNALNYKRVDNAQIEVVTNGQNGFVANYPSDIAKAMQMLSMSKELRTLMGDTGYDIATERYESTEVVGQFESIVEDIVCERPHGIVEDALINNQLEKEYEENVNNVMDTTTLPHKIVYKVDKFIYKIIEFMYLVNRKIMKKVFRMDIENRKHKKVSRWI